MDIPEKYRGSMSAGVIKIFNVDDRGKRRTSYLVATGAADTGTPGVKVNEYRGVNIVFLGKLENALVEINRGKQKIRNLDKYLEGMMKEE